MNHFDRHYASFMLFLWRVKDRIEELRKDRHVQSAEKLSCIGALSITAALAFTPHFFAGSGYLKELSKRVSEDAVMWWFLLFFVLQVAGVLYGGEPPAFDKHTPAKLHWLCYRRFLVVVGAMVWFVVVPLVSFPHITILSGIFAWTWGQCVGASIELTYQIKQEVLERALIAEEEAELLHLHSKLNETLTTGRVRGGSE